MNSVHNILLSTYAHMYSYVLYWYHITFDTFARINLVRVTPTMTTTLTTCWCSCQARNNRFLINKHRIWENRSDLRTSGCLHDCTTHANVIDCCRLSQHSGVVTVQYANILVSYSLMHIHKLKFSAFHYCASVSLLVMHTTALGCRLQCTGT